MSLNKLKVGDKLLVRSIAMGSFLETCGSSGSENDIIYEIEVKATKKVKISYE